MGASFTTRFREALAKGDTAEAYILYYNKKEVREDILPNGALIDHHGTGDSALHMAAYHAMRRLYTDLITKGGKPDLKNGRRRNCLHLICLKSDSPAERLEMLRVSLEVGLYEMDVEHVLAEKDGDGNTALHLAAGMGLCDCVEMLVEWRADVFLTNKQEETAADWATKSGFRDIATRLETKMVFPKEDEDAVVETDTARLEEIADAPTGLRDRDLRSMKDQLLVETADVLGVSLFNAELLLRKHGWSKEQLLDSWMADPEGTCSSAGVDYISALAGEEGEGRRDPLDQQPIATETSTQGAGLETQGEEGEEEEEEGVECGVCVSPCGRREVEMPCGHVFCRQCWQHYLHDKIEAGEARMTCPEFGCDTAVPLEVIDKLVSKQMDQKFLKFDIKEFVESNPNMRWCPYPGCSQAVGKTTPSEPVAMAPTPSPSEHDPAVNVSCGNDHYFCWGCGGDPHEPCSCARWREWLGLIKGMQPKIGTMTAAEADEAASSKWLATRSKPCPSCKAPIEKTEGCNHMCCKKCKHDFCWVCLDPWRCHNSSTGGYFDCNRYDAQKKAHDLLGNRIQMVIDDSREIEQISRFLHYYERYSEHKESMKLEEPYLGKAKHKMEELAIAVASMDQRPGSVAGGPLDLSFIEEAVQELLKARRVLSASYPYGFYVTSPVEQKMFESLQASLEQVAEMLAEVVARPHLRKPRSEIIRLTREAREKRARLVKEVKAGFPLPMPDALMRHHRYPRSRVNDLVASGSSPPPRDFMEIIDGLRSSSHKSQDRSHDHAGDTDNDLLRTLAMSREEYEADKKMKDDIELAKALSMTSSGDGGNPPRRPSPAAASSSSSGSDDIISWEGPKDRPFPILKLTPRSSQPLRSPLSPDLMINPFGPLEKHRQPSPVANGDPMGTFGTFSTGTSAKRTGNLPPVGRAKPRDSNPNGGTGSEWGPVYNEDEDLKRALELSMQAEGGEGRGGEEVLDSNRMDGDTQSTFPTDRDLALHLQEQENMLGDIHLKGERLKHAWRNSSSSSSNGGGNRLEPAFDERTLNWQQPFSSNRVENEEASTALNTSTAAGQRDRSDREDGFELVELEGGSILGDPNRDSNRRQRQGDEGEGISLPPELRHLLESSHRPGAQV